MKSIYIKDALIINEGLKYKGSVLIEDGRIIKIIEEDEDLEAIEVDEIIDAKGKILIPGVIDDQVHFRDLELSYKGDIYTESKAAIAGGITSYMDMPNTKPQTITQQLLEEKFQIAAGKSLANFSFYMGTTNDNIEEVLKTDPKKVCGIKIFMGSSTGNMLVDNKITLKEIFSKVKMLIAVHCEDEETIKIKSELFRQKFGEDVPMKYHPLIRSTDACFKSTAFAIDLARKFETRLHVLHISSAKELGLFDNSRPSKDKQITNEVCVHHLWFDERDYEKYGTLIKWNPAIKSRQDKEALVKAVLENKIDIIATDHAPHTLEEKQNTYFKAPSGGPMVQHSLVAILELYHQGKYKIEKIVEKMCHTPAEIFKIKDRGYIREGYWADLVLVDLNSEWEVTKDNILYKCKWSPFEGVKFKSKVTHTFVNGNLVYNEGAFNEEVKGVRLEFER